LMVSNGKKSTLTYTVLLLIVLGITLQAAQLSAGGSPNPLINETRTGIPEGLDWYPVAVFGDNRPEWTHYVKYPSVFYRIVDDMKTLNPVAVIGTGDHVGEGRPQQYEELYRTLSGLSNVWLVPGNHDFHWPGSHTYWHDYIGPDNYIIKSIPGWTFIFIDAVTSNATLFNQTVKDLFSQAGTARSIAIVTHYPVEPWLNHNLNQTDAGPEKQATMKYYIHKYNVSLVLEGHWHGYAEKREGTTLYIVTGGAGAPLYHAPSGSDADKIIEGLHHYLVFIFYPNGTYTYTTVYPEYGDLRVVKVNESTVLIHNTRLTLERKPATLPFRVDLSDGSANYTVLALVDSGKPEAITLIGGNPVEVGVTSGVHKVQVVHNNSRIPAKILRLDDKYAANLWSQYQNSKKNTETSTHQTPGQQSKTATGTSTSHTTATRSSTGSNGGQTSSTSTSSMLITREGRAGTIIAVLVLALFFATIAVVKKHY